MPRRTTTPAPPATEIINGLPIVWCDPPRRKPGRHDIYLPIFRAAANRGEWARLGTAKGTKRAAQDRLNSMRVSHGRAKRSGLVPAMTAKIDKADNGRFYIWFRLTETPVAA